MCFVATHAGPLHLYFTSFRSFCQVTSLVSGAGVASLVVVSLVSGVASLVVVFGDVGNVGHAFEGGDIVLRSEEKQCQPETK